MNPLNLFRFVPLSVLRQLARFTACVMTWMPHLDVHRIIRTNLKLAYPELSQPQRLAIHKKIIVNQALTSVESIKAWAMPPSWAIEQIHTVHQSHLLKNALANPNGMLAIVPHLGTWEMMNAWLNQFGNPTIMYKPVKNEWADDFVLQGRERLGAKLVPTDGSGVKAIFKTLKHGGFSIILPDHVPSKSAGGVVVPFFGIETLTSTLAPKLASKTKCALVGLACVRRETGEHRGKFDIYCYELTDADLYAKDVTLATTAFNRVIGHMINQHPAHYIWGYKRFKNIPKFGNAYKLTPQQLQNLLASVEHCSSHHSIHQSTHQ